MPATEPPKSLLIPLIGALAAGILILDLLLPQGVAEGMLYVLVVLISFWYPRRRFILTVATVCSVLTVLGLVLSPPGTARSIAVMNRLLALIVIWATAMMGLARRQAEAALQVTEARFRAMVEASPVPMLISRVSDGLILYANEQLGLTFGLSAQGMIGRMTPDFYADPADRQMVLNELERTGQLRNYEVRVKKADGTPFWVAESIQRFLYDREPSLLCGFYDITARKQLEGQLGEAQKLEVVGRLAGGVAHDFNNLLTIITGYSQFLLNRLSPEEELHRDVEEIKKAANRAASLTQQLLAFSRRQVLIPKVVDLNSVVAKMGELVQRLMGEDIHLMTTLEPGLGAVKADPVQLERVIMNLVVNARDAMPKGGRLTIQTANAEITEFPLHGESIIQPGRYVMLVVSDTGVGMDAETQACIFEPFFTTKAFGKGTGLGLSTVYGIVKQSGGHVLVQSGLGQGATITIYLPRIDETVESVEPEPAPVEAPYGTETILLAEDDPGVRMLVRDTLQLHGYTVLEARHGIEALVLSSQHPGRIDLLIADVIMPQINGREIAERLSRERHGLRVLYISGYTEQAVVHHGVLDPGTAFLQKPFTPDALARKVRAVLHPLPA